MRKSHPGLRAPCALWELEALIELQRRPPAQDISPGLAVEPRGNEKKEHREKKRARNPIIKTVAGTLRSSPHCSQSHISPRAQQRVRVLPHPNQPQGCGHSVGRSRAAPGAHTASFVAYVPSSPRGWDIPTRGASPTLYSTLQ